MNPELITTFFLNFEYWSFRVCLHFSLFLFFLILFIFFIFSYFLFFIYFFFLNLFILFLLNTWMSNPHLSTLLSSYSSTSWRLLLSILYQQDSRRTRGRSRNKGGCRAACLTAAWRHCGVTVQQTAAGTSLAESRALMTPTYRGEREKSKDFPKGGRHVIIVYRPRNWRRRGNKGYFKGRTSSGRDLEVRGVKKEGRWGDWRVTGG